jgi:hypothetical protein
MVTIFILLIALIALNMAAMKWGANTRDGLNSPEWKRKWGSIIP